MIRFLFDIITDTESFPGIVSFALLALPVSIDNIFLFRDTFLYHDDISYRCAYIASVTTLSAQNGDFLRY